MKKLILCATAALFIGYQAQAQRVDINIGGSGGMPIGDLALRADILYGGHIGVDYFIMPELSVGLEFGFMMSPTTKYNDIAGATESTVLMPVEERTNILPIMLTARYHLMPGTGFQPYFGLGVGYTNVSRTRTLDMSAFDDLEPEDIVFLQNLFRDGNTVQGGLGVTPHLGFKAFLSPRVALNVNAQYNLVFNKKTTDVPLPDSDPPVMIPTVDPATPYLSLHLGLTLDLFSKKYERF